jgi:hypothetical protein
MPELLPPPPHAVKVIISAMLAGRVKVETRMAIRKSPKRRFSTLVLIAIGNQ